MIYQRDVLYGEINKNVTFVKIYKEKNIICEKIVLII